MNKFYLMTPGLGIVTPSGYISYKDDPPVKIFDSLLSAVKFAQRFYDNHIWVIQENPYRQICSINKETKKITRLK